jgi:dTDP-4-amino-4,6-dideoxygalactose transaminase
MIPANRPAFGLGTAIAASLGVGRARADFQRLEEAYAEGSGCGEAIWLPSARAGIGWALCAAIGKQTQVVGPAFTCSVVHEAMVRSGGRIRLIDAGEEGFGMDLQTLHAAQHGDYALVLSEPYGHPYDLAQLAREAASPAVIRIVDSAMAVPHRSLFQRLQANDFAVISLGVRKSMFSGWGGFGFTRDRGLAEEVRKIRDARLAHGDFRLAAKRAVQTTLWTAAHYPLVFSLTRRLWHQALAVRARLARERQRQPAFTPAADTPLGFPAAWTDEGTCSPEWRLPSTYVDRRLALWNLIASESAHATRLALARRYHENLADAPSVIRPPASPFALSHYTVRVRAWIRERVKEQLYRAGVYTDSLWAFSPHLDRQIIPKAFRLSSEVINLPLSPWMKTSQVDRVCELLVQCLEDCSRSAAV